MTEQELKELAGKIEEEGGIGDVEGVEIIETVQATGKTRPPEEEEHATGEEWGFAICEDAPMGTGGSHNGDPCLWCGRYSEE